MASAVLHAFAVLLFLPASFYTDASEADQRILPALYLYAVDRSPRSPREIRLPVAEPLGTLGPDQPGRALGDRGDFELPSPHVIQGMLPSGWPDVTFDSVFSVLEVDSEVVRYGWSAAPSYPQTLLDAGIEGVVMSEFVVDTSGRVDPGSVKILSATDSAFGRSVEEALTEMRFRPAWRGKRKVSQLVRQPFRFYIQRPPPDPDTAS